MKGFYYIKNSIDEFRSEPSVYAETLEKAKEAIKYCADWYLSNGTGRIYFQPTEFEVVELTQEPNRFLGETEPVKYKRIRQPNAKFICRGKGLDENGEVIFSEEEY